jgi:radical SAM/Cys-rich protein
LDPRLVIEFIYNRLSQLLQIPDQDGERNWAIRATVSGPDPKQSMRPAGSLYCCRRGPKAEERRRMTGRLVQVPGPTDAPGSVCGEPSADFDGMLKSLGLPPLRRRRVRSLQLNVTTRCNLACHHCHVESGPKRTESMDRRTAERVLELLAENPQLESLDLTGGAPELSAHFRLLVRGARDLGRRVLDRCNLTVLFEAGQEQTAEFLAEQRVDIVASLPCYTRENVERQRGRGVFDASIEGLRRLNRLGYGLGAKEREAGTGEPRGRLDLVYNPIGPSLPPHQSELEACYRSELRELFGIEFDGLLTITNMPIKRFARALERSGRHAEYMSLLVNHFNPANLEGLMCRDLLSVGYDGRLYDCDFNQALEIETPGPERDVWELRSLEALEGCRVATGPHCFGCTAGSGSSCGGALS